MRYIFLFILFIGTLYASLDNIDSFEADFKQTIKDDKNKVLSYSGHIIASKPQNVLWQYTKPIKKDVYINQYRVTIVEKEIEQVIVRKLQSKLNFFSMIKSAKRVGDNRYEVIYKDSKFFITKDGNFIKTISYVDEFENNVKIIFTNQKVNKKIDYNIFVPNFPLDFDVIDD